MSWSVTGDNNNVQSVTTSSPTYTGLTAGATGDLRIFAHVIETNGITISSLSGGGVTTWHKLSGPFNDTSNTHFSYEIWAGVITSNATSITVNLSGTPNVNTIWYQMDFNSTNGTALWSGTAQANGHASGASSNTVNFPSLTSGLLGAEEFYVGFGIATSSASAGSDPGFTYEFDAGNNPRLYNLNLASSTAYSPKAPQASAGAYASIAVIIDDGATPSFSYYDPARVPNPNVGPIALRRSFKYPPPLYQEFDVASGSSNLTFNGTGTANTQDPSDSYRRVVIANNYVGPPALRRVFTLPEGSLRQDAEVAAVAASGTGNLDFEGIGVAGVQDPSDVYRRAVVPSNYVGPPVLRRLFTLPENNFRQDVQTFTGSSNLTFNGTGTAVEVDSATGTGNLTFNGTGTGSETDTASGAGNLTFNGTSTMSVGDPAEVYRAVRLASRFVGPQVLRRRFKQPEAAYEQNTQIYGSSAIILSGTGSAIVPSALSANPFTLHQNDYGIEYTCLLTDTNGNTIDLTNATAVNLRVADGIRGCFLNVAATNVLTAGIVSYTVKNTDFPYAGIFVADWHVTFSDGTSGTYPQNKYLKIVVYESLAKGPPGPF